MPAQDAEDFHQASYPYPLHLVERHFLAPPIVKLRRSRAGMGRYLSRRGRRKPEGEITEVSYMFPRPGADKTPVAKVRVYDRPMNAALFEEWVEK